MTPFLAVPALAARPLSIPSPSEGVWHLGPLPLRAYALCIILGAVVAIWIAERRWRVRGGNAGEVTDLAIWAIPFGLVGARLYHVATDWQLYFGEGRDPVSALYVWNGGLGIWGSVSFGALGVVIGCRRAGIRVWPMLDTLAPAVLLGQAIGRWGNWFNQELYGRPTDLPWALEIDPANRPSSDLAAETFHPTFLYESLWALGAFAVVVLLDRRLRLGHGRVVALYVMAYTLGRGWIETLRVDDVQLDDVLGLRWNVWTSIVLFLLAAAWFAFSWRRHPGREASVYRPDARGGSPAAQERAEAGTEDEESVAEGSRGTPDGDSGEPRLR